MQNLKAILATIPNLKQRLKELNHQRLARRTLLRARASGLPGCQNVTFHADGATAQTTAKRWANALTQLGVKADLAPSSVGPQPNALSVHINPSGARPAVESRFVLACSPDWLQTTSIAIQDAWLAAASWIWVTDLAQLRQLTAASIKPNRLYLIPTQETADSVPGAEFFRDAAAIQTFFIGRFFLAQLTIDYAAFWHAVSPLTTPLPDAICLGVVEYPDRMDAFLSENLHDIRYFPGLRHNIGWVGCGLSYKFLLGLAEKNQRPWIIICEDDVSLPTNWRRAVTEYLEASADEPSDMFSGLITDLPDETQLLEHLHRSDHKLVTIDQMTGTVFNIYRSGMYAHVRAWNERDMVLKSNAIDRFMSRKPGLRVVVRIPYLVGHKEGLSSTLWGGSNAMYVNRFDASLNKIEGMLTTASRKNGNGNCE